MNIMSSRTDQCVVRRRDVPSVSPKHLSLLQNYSTACGKSVQSLLDEALSFFVTVFVEPNLEALQEKHAVRAHN